MFSRSILCIMVLVWLGRTAYEPELMLTLTPDIINKQLSTNYGQNVTNAINALKINNITGEQSIAGLNTKYNLTQLVQQVTINWNANVIKVIDTQTFNLHAKNVNLTLKGELQLKVGLIKKLKGPLLVTASQLEISTNIKFIPTTCSEGLGFGLVVTEVNVDISKLVIKIEGKSFDNVVIYELQKILVPRLPGILQKAILTKVNPLILSIVCDKIQQKLPIGSEQYILTVNSTQVPTFKNNLQFLGIPVDVTLQNLVTNETNDELQRDDLPQSNKFSSVSDASLSLSSNFMNTLIWIVADSKLLHITVTNEMLGPTPPILLNTTNLSILMPKLKEKWPNKEVVLMVEPAGKFQHLLIRSGRILTVLSLSVKFVVILNKDDPFNATQCLSSGNCVVACNLNMTLPLSVSLRLSKKSAFGVIHTAQFFSIEKIQSQIDINLQTLRAIINEIVGSMVPDLNHELAQGLVLPDKIQQLLQKFDISEIKEQTFLDFVAVGLNFDI